MPNVFEIKHRAIEEFFYAMNQIPNAIAIYEASKMSENDLNLQSQSRSGHDWTPMQRLVHTRCLVVCMLVLLHEPGYGEIDRSVFEKKSFRGGQSCLGKDVNKSQPEKV